MHGRGRAAQWLRLALGSALLAGSLGGNLPAQAAVARYCEPPQELSVVQKDRLLQFGAILKQELADSGRDMALIARSGLDLSRFGMRYSHAGVSLKASPDTAWAVRQLYFACDEYKPLLYDQGIAAFVLGSNEPAIGYVSVVLLPAEQDEELGRAALDNQRALQLLGQNYSANAYPFSARYQNCNQWVLELLATAWGHLDTDAEGAVVRVRAQSWLQDQGYAPAVFDVGFRPLLWLGAFIPWVHADDHPDSDTAQALYRVSMPAAIEAFVQRTVPGATRIELCHTQQHVVIRRGWDPIADGCVPGPQDTVIALD